MGEGKEGEGVAFCNISSHMGARNFKGFSFVIIMVNGFTKLMGFPSGYSSELLANSGGYFICMQVSRYFVNMLETRASQLCYATPIHSVMPFRYLGYVLSPVYS